MEQLLTGKKVLVTGAGRGIGKAVAEGLVGEGAKVALHYNRSRNEAANLQSLYGDSIQSFQADLSDLKQVIPLFEKVISEMNDIDVLINNAGIALNSDLFGKNQDWIEAWNRTMNVNLNAAALLCRQAILHFTGSGKGGKIINVASRAAFRGDAAEYLAYAASKGGLVALTRSIARAYGRKGIVAFIIAPGFVKTDMAQQFIDQYGKDYATREISLNTLTMPEDIAPLIVFLASGKADHATGGTFDINAGSYVH